MRIEVSNLIKQYGRGNLALDDVSLAFDTGMFGLLGPNGAGKTTLMRILATLVEPSAGQVKIGEWSLSSRRDRRSIRAVLGYLPQDLQLYPELTAAEMVEYIALLKGIGDAALRRRRTTELLETVGLAALATTRVRELSGGMRQRVGIAQALVNDPALLVVDEPTAGLDPEERLRFRNLLVDLARERSVLLSTHIVEDIAHSCERLAILAAGRVAFDGTVGELSHRAAGRVWRTREEPSVRGEVVATTPDANGTVWRTVGSRPSGGEPAEPSVEDGYIAVIKAIAPPDRVTMEPGGRPRWPGLR